MDQNQNQTTMPVARLDPAVLNLDPSLSHLDKSALPTTKDNASRAIGDGPAFIDAFKIPFFNSTAESRKELTGTTADEQGMRITQPQAGASNFNAPMQQQQGMPTSTVTDGVVPARAYANTGSSVAQRSEESGLPTGQELPTGASTFGPGGPAQAGPTYAYNKPHDLLTSAGPTRPPVGVNEQVNADQPRREEIPAQNSKAVAAQGPFNDPTLASGQNLQDPNLRQGAIGGIGGIQQQGFQQQQGLPRDDISARTHHINLDDRPAGFMVGPVEPTRYSSDSISQDFNNDSSIDPRERLPGTFVRPDFRSSQLASDLPQGVEHTIDPALSREIRHHPQLQHVDSGLLEQQEQRRLQNLQSGSQGQERMIDPALSQEIRHHPQLQHVDSSLLEQQEQRPLQAAQQELGQQQFQGLDRSDSQRPIIDSSLQQGGQYFSTHPAYDPILSQSSFSQSSLGQQSIDSERVANHPEFSSTAAGSSSLQDRHTTGQRFASSQPMQTESIRRDIPVQNVQQQDFSRLQGVQGDLQQWEQQQQQQPTFQGQNISDRPVVGPAEPFQPGVHSGLRYAEPTEGLPGHSTYRA